MESEITLEEYLEIVRKEIEEFKERYVEGHEQDPKKLSFKDD